MTQILGVVTRSCSFHVSDRLLTRSSQSGYETFDTLSNKSVVFFASDALITIGYSGQAFIDGQPTDEWIVAGLLDIDHPLPSLAWGPKSLVPQWPNLGEAIERLRLKAMKVLSESVFDRDSAITISIEGWRWKKRSGNRILGYPVVCKIRPLSNSYVTNYLPKYWAWDREHRLHMNPAGSLKEIGDLNNEINTHGIQSPDELVDVLVRGVRRIADKRPNVGKDVMCIMITPRSSPQVRVQYQPENPTDYSTHRASNDRTILGSYSPWIVTNEIVWPPAISTAGWSTMGGFSWSLKGVPTAPTGPKIGFSKLQKRSTFP